MYFQRIGFVFLVSLMIFGGLSAGVSVQARSPFGESNDAQSAAQSGQADSPAASANSVNTASPDYQTFIQPSLANIELVRSYLMTPYSQGHAGGLGYNSQYGLIEGGNWPNSCQTGNGITICPQKTAAANAGITCPSSTCFLTNKAGAVLIDNNLMIGSTLDYLNSLKGISTNILGNTRNYLSQQFVNPTGPSGTYSYNGQDRREIFLGNTSPYYGKINCVYQGGTQDWYTVGHNYNQSFPITTELPNLSVADSSKGCAAEWNPIS